MMAAPSDTPILIPTMPLGRWLSLALLGMMILLALFVILAMVRLWGSRVQTRTRVTGGLDLDQLQAQRDAGQMSLEEYNAVRQQLGGRPATLSDTKAELPPIVPPEPAGGDADEDAGKESASNE